MSPRTLQRQFHDATGMAPYEWLVRERVAIARELLEAQGALPMARVAEARRLRFGGIAAPALQAHRADESRSVS